MPQRGSETFPYFNTVQCLLCADAHGSQSERMAGERFNRSGDRMADISGSGAERNQFRRSSPEGHRPVAWV